MLPKYSSPYFLIKPVLEKDPIYSFYRGEPRTGAHEVWGMKVISQQRARQCNLSECIEYNEEVLRNLQGKPNIIYVKEIFLKDGMTFFVQQLHMKRLSNYLREQKALEGAEVERIIQQMFGAMKDLYEEGYMHCGLRPEHFVLVDNEWKLETLVLDNEFHTDSLYSWTPIFASPEEKKSKDSGLLDEDVLMAQLVWRFAIIAVFLLLGEHVVQKEWNSQEDIPWNQIKNKTMKAPDLSNMLKRSLCMDYASRISLKQFIKLPIFREHYATSLDQYFDPKITKLSQNILFSNSVRFGKSTTLKKSTRPPSPRIPHPPPLPDKNNQRLQQQLLRCQYFLEVDQYTTALDKQNRPIVEYCFTKVAGYFILELRTLLMGKECDDYRKASDYLKFDSQLKKIESSAQQKLKIKSAQFQSVKGGWLPHPNVKPAQLLSDIDKQILLKYFNLIAGLSYKSLLDNCESPMGQQAKLSLCYFTLAAYLGNYFQPQILQQFKLPNHQLAQFGAYIRQTDINRLLPQTQKLLKESFRTQE